MELHITDERYLSIIGFIFSGSNFLVLATKMVLHHAASKVM